MLWFVAAAAGLAVTFVRTATGDRYMVVTQIDAIRAKALTQDALAKAMLVLSGRTNRPLPRAMRWTQPEGQVTVRVESEAAKVDLNAADRTLLDGLARAVGIANGQADEIGDAIVDWRDEDKAKQPNGAEAQDYGSSDRDYGPADKPFRQLEELRYVLPVDNLAYARMLPHLTIYTGRAEPDRRLASPIVRAAMDLQRGLKPHTDPQDAGKTQDEGSSRSSSSSSSSRSYTGPTGMAARGFNSSMRSRSPAGPTSTPQPGGGSGGGSGGGTGSDPGTVYTLHIDVRLGEGYESHTSTVVALANGEGGRAIRILDWTAALPAPTP